MANKVMNKVDRWLLPDGIEEVLPEQARQIESFRRQLIDLFESWGYDYVIPPLVEFTDSLLTGTGQDIDLLTFKLTDQISGKTLGIRADITPQVARMDAHSLNRTGVNRLCYGGHVLHTVPKSPISSRSPIKLGVEMFGVPQIEAEIEVISLLLETLSLAGLEKQYIDVGHVEIFRSLAEMAGLDREQEATLFSLLQSKALTEIDAWLDSNIAEGELKSWLAALPRLSGNGKVIKRAREAFKNAPNKIHSTLDELQVLSEVVNERFPLAQLYFDLSELRGYHYHTGIVFGAFAPGVGNAIASGGRYDRVGDAFGRARSAAGFDVDLSALSQLINIDSDKRAGIFVATSDCSAVWAKIQELRAQSERVVMGVPGQAGALEYQKCDRVLVLRDEEYIVETLV